MTTRPVLAIQPRRLGDLILSLPLFARLRGLYPQSPLWIVAEPLFYGELAPLLPTAQFLPPVRLAELVRAPWQAIVNLGPGENAAIFTGKANAELKLGRVASEDGLRVQGFWQLYRHALTQNNRHNTFHWSNLDFLDLYSTLPAPNIPWIRPKPTGKKLVGLFVGASDPAKRPDAPFWARLARRLGQEGYKPVLLGGKAEVGLGREIAARCGPRHVNLCGRQNLGQLATTLKSLDLLISPDTGPMHLGNLVGTPVLNLSMGNVHAAETGPASPGQWVLRAAMSCVGCWTCQRAKLYCKNAFNPLGVGNLALAILNGDEAGIASAIPPRLELLRTGQDGFGLATLLPFSPHPSPCSSSPPALDAFWRAAFISFGFAGHDQDLLLAAHKLRSLYPDLALKLRDRLGKILSSFLQAMSRGQNFPEDFWRSQPEICRLFTGHTQMSLQNADYARSEWKLATDRTAMLADSLSK